MATTDVFIISSSPPRRLPYHITSSPPLPSLDEMVNETKASNLGKGSGIAPVFTSATTGFASASTLLRKSSSGSLQGFDSARSFATSAVKDGNDLKKSAKSKAPRKTAPKKEDATVEKVAKLSRKIVKKDEDVDRAVVEKAVGEVADIIAEKKPRKPRAKKGDDAEGKSGSVAEATVEKKPRKPRAKKGDEVTGEDVKEKVPRKPRAKKADVEAGTETVPKEKAVKKPRAKKSDLDSNLQSKMAKGRVTKSATNASNANKVETSKADTVSKHFAPNPVVEDTVAEEGFGLVEAMRRRTNWTPPKPTNVPIDLEDSPEAQGSDTSKGFAELLRSFGCSSNETDSIEKRISSGLSNATAATRKRKLIEMVTTNIPRETGSKITKEKAVKKKARTLTDLATSAYATAEDDGDFLDAPAPLLQYFPQVVPEGSKNDDFKIPPKPRSKSPMKRVQKSKKGSAEEPILLSPESAMEQVSDQDFVFGTSSQLAREDSPSLLRDLHDAMQASNELDDYDDPFVSPPTKIAERGKAVVAAKRNLWSVAARDNHGDLMDIETMDLARTPIAKPDRIILSENPSSLVTPGKDEWFDIDEIEDHRPPSTQVPVREMGPIERSINFYLSESPIQPRNTSKDTSKSSPQKKGPKSLVGKSITPKKADASKMPDYESFTTPQLTREIHKYKFKQIKSRKRMIDLLIQCHESQNRPTLGVLQGNIPITTQNPLEKSRDVAESSSQAEPTIPSPRRARAKKVTTSTASLPKSKSKAKSKMADTMTFLETDSDTPLSEIRTPRKSRKGKQPLEATSDSDNPTKRWPRRRSTSRTRKVSKTLEISPPDDTQDDEAQQAQQAQLFTHIYTAITNAPPSQDPSNLSWHEKILLYDPIILEDLTSWLNTGALSKTGWDEEVAPMVVKKWCESKSICCLWRENQGGAARSRL